MLLLAAERPKKIALQRCVLRDCIGKNSRDAVHRRRALGGHDRRSYQSLGPLSRRLSLLLSFILRCLRLAAAATGGKSGNATNEDEDRDKLHNAKAEGFHTHFFSCLFVRFRLPGE